MTLSQPGIVDHYWPSATHAVGNMIRSGLPRLHTPPKKRQGSYGVLTPVEELANGVGFRLIAVLNERSCNAIRSASLYFTFLCRIPISIGSLYEREVFRVDIKPVQFERWPTPYRNPPDMHADILP